MKYFENRLRAFGYAFTGLKDSFVRETHIKIHSLSAVAVILAGIYFSLSALHWLFLALSISLVFITELMNTAVEKICDVAQPEKHPTIRYVKDISAAAVLIAVIFAIVTGILVFWPHLKSLTLSAS